MAKRNPMACRYFTPSLAGCNVVVFKKCSQYPPIIEDTDLNILEKFVINMYDKHNTIGKVDVVILLRRKGLMMPFHQKAHPSFNM